MKEYLLLIILSILPLSSYSQCKGGNYELNLDDSMNFCHLIIDTLSDTDNVWQVGRPQKSVFTDAASPQNVIITDSLHPYNTNDTSSFIIGNTAGHYGGFVYSHTVEIWGRYYVNSDTLTDFGKIEFSPDNGGTWIDLINDTTYAASILWGGGKPPVLSGNSNGWTDFAFSIAKLGPILGIHGGDTVLYRFTFISDSVQTNKDGLMYDDLLFQDWTEGVDDLSNQNLVSVSPNPVKDKLSLNCHFISNRARVSLFNITGAKVKELDYFSGDLIDISTLENGVYLLLYSDTDHNIMNRFTVIR